MKGIANTGANFLLIRNPCYWYYNWDPQGHFCNGRVISLSVQRRAQSWFLPVAQGPEQPAVCSWPCSVQGPWNGWSPEMPSTRSCSATPIPEFLSCQPAQTLGSLPALHHSQPSWAPFDPPGSAVVQMLFDCLVTSPALPFSQSQQL